MDSNQPKTDELPTTFPSPSKLVELNKSIDSKLEGLRNSTSIEEQKKLASDLWLNLLHKEANLKAIDFSHKMKFLEQQPPNFLKKCNKIWSTIVNSAKERATIALDCLSHNSKLIEEADGRDSSDTFDAYNDEIDNVWKQLSQIREILNNFKLTQVFAEASSDLPDQIRVDPTEDHNYRRQKILKTEEPPASENNSHLDCNELLEKVKNSINIDEQKKLTSDLWLNLLYMPSESKNKKLKIDTPEQQNFSTKCEDIFTKLVESAKRKVTLLLSIYEKCYVDVEDDSYYDDEKTEAIQEVARQINKLIKILEDLDMNKVFTGVLRSP